MIVPFTFSLSSWTGADLAGFRAHRFFLASTVKKKKGPVTAEVKAPWTVLTPSDQEEVGSKTQYLAGEETRLNVSGSYKVREMILTSRHWALMPVLGELCSLNLYKNPGG